MFHEILSTARDKQAWPDSTHGSHSLIQYCNYAMLILTAFPLLCQGSLVPSLIPGLAQLSVASSTELDGVWEQGNSFPDPWCSTCTQVLY